MGLRYSPLPAGCTWYTESRPLYSNQSNRATGAELGAALVRADCASAAETSVTSRAKSGAIVRIEPPAAWTVEFRGTSTLSMLAARSRIAFGSEPDFRERRIGIAIDEVSLPSQLRA